MPDARADAPSEHELHRTLLASRRLARQRLLAVQSVEWHHGDMPLVDLAALAASGALHHLVPPAGDVLA